MKRYELDQRGARLLVVLIPSNHESKVFDRTVQPLDVGRREKTQCVVLFVSKPLASDAFIGI